MLFSIIGVHLAIIFCTIYDMLLTDLFFSQLLTGSEEATAHSWGE